MTVNRFALVGLGCFGLCSTAFALPGSGTEVDPYQIATCADLRDINNDLAAHYLLVQDVECDIPPYNQSYFENGGQLPEYFGMLAGPSGTHFTGSLDGGGFAINGLHIKRDVSTSYVGLFGTTDGDVTIRDLTFTNFVGEVSTGFGGGLVGACGTGLLTIDNVHIEGTVEGRSAGGMVGFCNKVHITDSGMVGTVTGHAGGGLIYGVGSDCTPQTCSIERSYFRGDIVGVGIGDAGGLMAFNNSPIAIRESYAVVKIRGGDRDLGGLAGELERGSTVEDSYAHVDIVSTDSSVHAGGIAGRMEEASLTRVYSTGIINSPESGGLASEGGLYSTITANISHSLSTTQMSLSQYKVGLLLSVSSTGAADFDNVYAVIGATGPTRCAGDYRDKGCTFASAASDFFASDHPVYATWDFTNVWQARPGQDLPVLLNNPEPLVCDIGEPTDWTGDGSVDGCASPLATISPAATIAPGATIGNATIEDGAVIGAGTTVSDGVFIGRYAQVGSSVILGDNVFVAPRASIDPQTELQSGTIVGRNASIASGVILGPESVVGRTASIGSNSEFPSGLLLGYAGTIGEGVLVDEEVTVGSLAQLGSVPANSGAGYFPSFEAECTGPIILARGAQLSTNSSGFLRCDGAVTLGPDSQFVLGGMFGDDVRVRKDVTAFGRIWLEEDVRIGRNVTVPYLTRVHRGHRIATGGLLCNSADVDEDVGRGQTATSCL